MLSKSLKQEYFKNTSRMLLPEDRGQTNLQLAATVAANFAEMGFVMQRSMVEELGRASHDDIVTFYKHYMPVLREEIGEGWKYETFYPNFPQEVIERDHLDIFLDQVIYGLSGLQIEPKLYEEAEERFPFLGNGRCKTIEKDTEEGFLKYMKQTLASQRAWTPQQRELVEHFIKGYPEIEKALPEPKEMKNHENAVMLVCIMQDAKKDKSEKYLQTATDVLRYAAVRSAQYDIKRNKGTIPEIGRTVNTDVYHYASLRFPRYQRPSFAFTKAERKRILGMLERLSHKTDIAAEMTQKKQMWKWLIKNMHINHMEGYDKLYGAFFKIAENQTIDRPQRRIEEAIKAEDLDTLMKELRSRPGDFTRRFDKLIRMAIKDGRENEVIDLFSAVAVKSGINAALGLAGSLKARTQEEKERYFKNAEGKVWTTAEKNREPIPKEFVDRVMDVCKTAMVERFAGKPSFGKVYISPEMKDYAVPTDMRNAAPGLHSYTPGSKVAMHTTENWLRLFASWTNTETHYIDIDLSAQAYRENGDGIHIGWNAMYHTGGKRVEDNLGIYSGDKRDGGPVSGGGVAEYIDLNLPLLKREGYRYVAVNLNSFTGVKFSEQPNAYFGFMFRNKEDLGKDFEPKTVQERYKLMADATQEVAAVYDIKEDKLIWIDMQLQERVATRSVDRMQDIINQVTEKSVMSLDELIRINAQATGSIEVYDPKEADTIFAGEREMAEYREKNPYFIEEDKTIIYPYDISYITGELMRDGEVKEEHTRDDLSQPYDDNERIQSILGEDIENTDPERQEEEQEQ